jgi:hypothetical protein
LAAPRPRPLAAKRFQYAAAVHWRDVRRGELIAAVSGVALAVSIFLHWYSTNSANRFSRIDGKPFQTVSAWQSERIVSILLLLAAAAPLILLWIILRQHKLSWPRGEMTAVVAITAFVLILVIGLVSRPGEPRDTISLGVGWYIAVAASIGMVIGAAQRSTRGAGPRKPPGTL